MGLMGMASSAQITAAINRALNKAMFDIHAEMVKTCPAVTGRLRNSIRVHGAGNKITLSANTDYAEDVEYGTIRMERAHGKHDPENPVKTWKAKTERGAGETAQMMPFLRPALHKGVRKFIPQRLREELGKLA